MHAVAASMTDEPKAPPRRQSADERLARAERRFAAAMNAIADAFYAMDSEWRIVVFNAAAERYFGFPAPQVLSRNLWDVFPQGRGRRYEAMCRKAKEGERSTLVMPSALRPGRSVEITFAPWDDGVCIAITDITDRQSKEAQVRHLMAEVNHRSKNLLSVVQAVARQTAAKSPKDFVSSFEQRLLALAKAQDLLIKGAWRHVWLEDLIRSELEHFAALIGRRVILDGPKVAVTPAAAQGLGMAFHELATNAAKYGALSNDVGAITITWRLEEGAGAQLTLAWREVGGPTVTGPVSKGFGSSVIGPMVRSGLGADVDIAFNPEGLTWRFACPAERVVAPQASPPAETEDAAVEPRAGRSPAQSRGSILVVEDEPLVAMEIADALNQAGFTVIGPVASNADAFAMLAQRSCDGAVLDVNLGHETSEPLALRLAADAVPFVTLTGYSPDQVPAAFQDAPLLTKPIISDVLVAELADRIGRSGPP
jgi:PAS domain S-box-containing protein